MVLIRRPLDPLFEFEGCRGEVEVPLCSEDEHIPVDHRREAFTGHVINTRGPECWRHAVRRNRAIPTRSNRAGTAPGEEVHTL